MAGMLSKVLEHLEKDRPEALERLFEFLRIPSVSTDPAYAAACSQAAEWTSRQLQLCGLNTKNHPTQGHPVVLGTCDDAGPGAPRLLFYGHYDVQPPDPLNLWTSPPFEPQIRDGRIYARGASDDKGQVMTFIEALRAWKAVAGKPPVNVTVIIEGEEECGNETIDRFLEDHTELLRADVAAVSDTSMWNAQTPAITYGLRGLAYFDIKLFGPSRDLHSGVYGGSVPNPATELALILGSLFDSNHHVSIPGFYDGVQPASDAEKASWNDLKFQDSAYAASIGLKAVHGEAGYSTLERRWTRPSCDVNGLYGGYMGEGAKTVIPAFAGAKVSFRLVPGQNPNTIGDQFTKWLESRCPPGCRWKITSYGAAHPVVVPIDSPFLSAGKRALETGFQKKPVLVRDGATIPVVARLQQLLKIDTLLLGFGLNDDNLHSPNEKFDLANFYGGCRTHAALLAELLNRPSK